MLLSKGNSLYSLDACDGEFRFQNHLKLKSERHNRETGRRREKVLDITFRNLSEVQLDEMREKDRWACLP